MVRLLHLTGSPVRCNHITDLDRDPELIEILNVFHTALDESNAKETGNMPEWAVNLMATAQQILDLIDPLEDE